MEYYNHINPLLCGLKTLGQKWLSRAKKGLLTLAVLLA